MTLGYKRWRSAADFDLGVKEDGGDGNYKVETGNDSPRLTGNGLTIANLLGDRFSKDDGDGDTWKLNLVGDGGSASIANGVLNISIPSGTTKNRGVELATQLAGDFDVYAHFDVSNQSDTNDWSARIVISDGVDSYYLGRSYIAGANKFVTDISNAVEATTLTDFWLRVKRASNGKLYTYYYDNEWHLLGSVVPLIDLGVNVNIQLRCYTANSKPAVDIDIDDFTVLVGTAVSNPYRTSGIWTSEIIDTGGQNHIKQLSWEDFINSGGGLTMELSASDTIGGIGGSWETITNSDDEPSSEQDKRYYQVKATLTSDGDARVYINNIFLGWWYYGHFGNVIDNADSVVYSYRKLI